VFEIAQTKEDVSVSARYENGEIFTAEGK
jgi:hypothetical protein